MLPPVFPQAIFAYTLLVELVWPISTIMFNFSVQSHWLTIQTQFLNTCLTPQDQEWPQDYPGWPPPSLCGYPLLFKVQFICLELKLFMSTWLDLIWLMLVWDEVIHNVWETVIVLSQPLASLCFGFGFSCPIHTFSIYFKIYFTNWKSQLYSWSELIYFVSWSELFFPPISTSIFNWVKLWFMSMLEYSLFHSLYKLRGCDSSPPPPSNNIMLYFCSLRLSAIIS